MRLRFRNLYQNPKNQPLSSLQSSNRSIVIQTYDKVDSQIDYKSSISRQKYLESNNNQYSSFEKKLKDYKQNLLHLLEKSKNQKECYMKRMIDLTNQSKSRIGSSRENYSSYSTISTKYTSQTPMGNHNFKINSENDQKPNHILRPCKSPQLDNSILQNKQDMKVSRNKQMKKSRRGSINSSINSSISHSRDKSNSRSFSKKTLVGNITPKEMNETHKMMRRKEELEEELKRLNRNIMLRQKIKSKLTIS